MTPTAPWRPATSPMQDQIRWRCSPSNPDKKKFVCVSGPRKSSKTIGCLHAIVQHAWETDRGRVCIISPSITAASDAGPWDQLVNSIIPEWIAADFGLEWVREPYQEGVSKKLKCSITNRHGNTTTFQLESMKEGEGEIGKRFKGKAFSMLYWSEVGSWVKQRSSFDMVMECLRMPHLQGREHVMLLDTNPADEGERSWIYQLFYKFRNLDLPELNAAAKERGLEGTDLLALRDQLDLLEVFVGDNPYLTASDLALLKAQYAHSPDLWNRYYLGKWTTAAGDSIFYDVFRPAIHVVGDIETPTNPEPEMMLPEEGTHELYTGWDLGHSNHAVVIIERFLAAGKTEGVAGFKVLDEIVFIRSDETVGDITEMMLKKMRYWETVAGRKFRWTHYSDRSAFDAREPISDRYHFEEIELASHGEITMQGVARKHGSVFFRVDLVRKLLHQDRLFVNNDKCPMLIQSLQGLKKGRNGAAVDRQSDHKHAFDALTYALSALCYDELQRAISQDMNTNRPKGGGGIIAVPL